MSVPVRDHLLVKTWWVNEQIKLRDTEIADSHNPSRENISDKRVGRTILMTKEKKEMKLARHLNYCTQVA